MVLPFFATNSRSVKRVGAKELTQATGFLKQRIINRLSSCQKAGKLLLCSRPGQPAVPSARWRGYPLPKVSEMNDFTPPTLAQKYVKSNNAIT
jgi:hypothetical protein